MTGALLYHERRNFLARGPAVLVLAVALLALVYAGWSGDNWRDARIGSLETFEAEKLAELDEFRTELAAIEAGSVEPTPFAANPMSILLPASLPPASLGDFAVGHADLHPVSAEISAWRNLSSIFGRYQFDNPTTLAASAFDVALVVVLVMPVLMIAVSFDVLASERTSGALSMILAAPVRASRVVWTRLLFRNALLWLLAIAAMTLLVVVNGDGGDRYARFGLWLAVCLAYAVFWLAALAFCVARCKSAMNTAAAMVGLWLLLVVGVPAAIATATEAAYPTPSRLAFLSDIREAQGAARRDLAAVTEGYLLDHPELSVGDDSLPSFYRAAFLANQAARESTRPILDEYEQARDGRARTLAFAQYLSPAIIAQRLLVAAAGGDLERQHRFQTQARAALDALTATIGPAVVSRNRVSVAELDSLEPFVFEDRPVGSLWGMALLPLLYLLAVSLAVAVLAHGPLARLTPKD